MSTYTDKLEEESQMLKQIIDFDNRLIRDYEALIQDYRKRILEERHEFQERLKKVSKG